MGVQRNKMRVQRYRGLMTITGEIRQRAFILGSGRSQVTANAILASYLSFFRHSFLRTFTVNALLGSYFSFLQT
ncbi:hypothetical protein VTK56DRAFT_2405 [Thermocarpiscus australiensis]